MGWLLTVSVKGDAAPKSTTEINHIQVKTSFPFKIIQEPYLLMVQQDEEKLPAPP